LTADKTGQRDAKQRADACDHALGKLRAGEDRNKQAKTSPVGVHERKKFVVHRDRELRTKRHSNDRDATASYSAETGDLLGTFAGCGRPAETTIGSASLQDRATYLLSTGSNNARAITLF
jgi:hypothetical protein